METVDLHDKAAMEESSSFIDAKELYAVSKRVQKLRSFRVYILSSINLDTKTKNLNGC